MRRLEPTALLPALLALALASSAAALEGAAPAPEAGACREEIQALCPDGGGGERRAVLRCIREHADELSPGCRDRVEQGGRRLRGAFRALRASCADDIEQHCADVEHGGGRVVRCLEDHSDAISEPCHDTLGQLVREREERRARRDGE